MYRERLTITLDKELLAAVDATIDHSQIRNRSHAIEHTLREGLALHELTEAVFAVEEASPLLPQLLENLNRFPIQHYTLITKAAALPVAQEISSSITQLSGKPSSLLSGDFGTGAALTLAKDTLKKPFFYILLSSTLKIPEQLTASFIAHRKSGNVVTQIVQSPHFATLTSTGIFLLNAEILAEIPPGFVSLEEKIFPALVKAGKVGVYVTV